MFVNHAHFAALVTLSKCCRFNFHVAVSTFNFVLELFYTFSQVSLRIKHFLSLLPVCASLVTQSTQLAMTVISSHVVQDDHSMAAHRVRVCLVCEDVKQFYLHLQYITFSVCYKCHSVTKFCFKWQFNATVQCSVFLKVILVLNFDYKKRNDVSLEYSEQVCYPIVSGLFYSWQLEVNVTRLTDQRSYFREACR